MNDEMKILFLRLNEVTSTIRSLVESEQLPESWHLDCGRDVEIAQVARSQATRPDISATDVPEKDGQQELGIVEAMISARGLRARYFDSDLFFDPTWSMLIDLYRAELKGTQLSVTSVCYGSGVAGTTALRYIKLLEDRGYIYRVPDPEDKRRAFLRLTGSAMERLQAYFDTVQSHCRAA